MSKRKTEPEIVEFREKVLTAFKAIRKHGLLARANIAGSEKAGMEKLLKLCEEQKKSGGVFFDNQDEATLNSSILTVDVTFVGYGDMSADAVAEIAIVELQKAGLSAERVDSRIRVAAAVLTTVKA